jgi:hypothetical protein
LNPLFLCYNSVENVVALAKPSAIFVAGRSNRNALEFQEARRKGAEVYAYFDVAEVPNTRVSALDDQFYMGDRTSVPRWTPERVIYPNHKLADISVGSPWADFAIKYLSEVMASGKFDGFFLDVIGGRLWGSSGWTGWPEAERLRWQDGVLDFIRRLDQARMEINPDFILVNNNSWQYLHAGEQYVNGVCLEGINPATNTYIVNYATRPFGVPSRRRVLALTGDLTRANIWQTVAGVTHVGYTPEGYGKATTPLVGYEDLRVPELLVKVAELERQVVLYEQQVSAALAALEQEQTKTVSLNGIIDTIHRLSER